MSKNFHRAIDFVLKWEGGHVDIEEDRGGETIYGISKNNHPEMFEDGLPTKREAKQFYWSEYWNNDRIQPGNITDLKLSTYLFDCGVNHGVVRATQMIQLACNRIHENNIDVDGWVGPVTLSKIEMLNSDRLLDSLVIKRIKLYNRIINSDRTQKKFITGWLNRALDIYSWNPKGD